MNTEPNCSAADFMHDEYLVDYDYYDDDLVSDYDTEDDYESDSDYDYDYDSIKIIDMNEHFRSLELKRLRLFLQGKYEMEEGEVLAAFDICSDDEQIACDLAAAYIKVLDGFKNCLSLDDVTNFILDTADTLKLNSAQALKVHAVLLGEAIRQTM